MDLVILTKATYDLILMINFQAKNQIMKTILSLTILFFCLQSFSQTFTKITSGDLVNTSSASRSANFVDVNGDGWDDIFISNGPSNGQNNMLYLNNQDGTFTTVTNDPIVQDNSGSDGASFADVDNDGDLDACVVTWHNQINYFYRNNGNGQFSHESIAPSVQTDLIPKQPPGEIMTMMDL